MSDVSKKYILNLCENDLSDHLTDFFLEMGVELCNQIPENEYIEFVLIDNESTTISVNSSVLFVGHLIGRVNFFKNNGVAVISNDLVKGSIEEVILKRLLGENSSLNIEKAFDTKIDSNGSFKVTDHLNSGYYCDLLATKAALNEFSFINVRNSFFNLMNFISLVIDSDSGEFPVDIDFGMSEDKFVIQSHFNVEDFGAEFLWNSLGEDENCFLSNCLEYIETIDCYILEKTGRLVLTMILSKEESHLKNICIHNIKSFNVISIEEISGKMNSISIDNFQDVKLASEKIKSISKVQDLLESKRVEGGHLVSITRVTKYLKKLDISLENFSLDNFDQFVSDYPNKEVIELLTISDKTLIIESILNETTFKNLSDSLEEVEKVVGIDDFLESLVTRIDGLSVDEANEIIILGGSEEADSSVVVSGWQEDLGESNQLIKGSREDLTEPTQLIKGSREDLTEESLIVKGEKVLEDNSKVVIKSDSYQDSNESKAQWSTAKSDIIEEVRKRASLLKESGKSLKDLNQEVSEIVSSKLGIKSGDSDSLSKGLFENASEKFVTDKNIGKPNGGDAVRAKLENDKLKSDLDKRDSQLVRMKRIIDGMKKELAVQKNEGSSISDELTVGPVVTANIDVIKLNAEVDKKDKQIELLKKNLEVANQNTEQLKNKTIDDNEPLEVASLSDGLELKNLKGEVRKLESQLQMALSRAESSNERAEKEKESSSSRSTSESKIFREKLAKSQEVIGQFQKDNSSLSREVFEYKRLKEEFENKANLLASNDHSEELKEKDSRLNEIAKVAKQNEDRYRAANLRIKQLEQKNKFLTAQVSQSSKKGSSAGTAGAATKMDPKASHKLKQLERVNEKLKTSTTKYEGEIIAKKKEVHQFKLENNTLKMKIEELERKVTKLDKKAA